MERSESILNGNGTVSLVIRTVGGTSSEKYDISKSDVSAYDLLSMRHDIRLDVGGNVIKCIDSECAQSGYWWPMYVNSVFSSYGVHEYMIKDGDIIEFRFAKK